MPPSPPPVSFSPGKRKRSRMSDGRDTEDEQTHEPATRDPSPDDGDGTAADGADDVSPTPRASRPVFQPSLALRASGQPSQPFASASASLPTSASGSRLSRGPTSPVERLVDLQGLAKPINFTGLSNSPLSRLPPDAHGLFSSIRRVAQWRMAFIPSASRKALAKMVPESLDWPDMWFKPPGEEGRRTQEEFRPWATTREDEDVSWLAWRQVDAFLAIQQEALECENQGRGELDWNVLVHSQGLRLAAGSTDCGVAYEPIMSAGIANQWLPEMANRPTAAKVKDVASGKMVDFALVLDLTKRRPANAALAKAVIETVTSQLEGSRSINQTMYEPLAFKPIGVSIKTKTIVSAGGNGSVQLGIWVAAWHRRVAELLLVPPGGIITLPLLRCHGHGWDLYFACDRGNEIEVIGPISMGGTQDLLSLYSLHACLRQLCEWVGGPFREWLTAALGVTAE
ncbi:hypothetical protein RB595_005141 [Gaeumannomyces hyphopodioides]